MGVSPRRFGRHPARGRRGWCFFALAPACTRALDALNRSRECASPVSHARARSLLFARRLLLSALQHRCAARPGSGTLSASRACSRVVRLRVNVRLWRVARAFPALYSCCVLCDLVVTLAIAHARGACVARACPRTFLRLVARPLDRWYVDLVACCLRARC